MKKFLIALPLLCLVAGQALADDAAALRTRLAKVNAFSAHFDQTVLDQHGKILQKASGEMQVARPDRFRWDTQKPDENLIISDGKTVWVYDPFVGQVSILSLGKAIENTPFLLITSSDPAIWSHYQVQQDGNSFTVTSRSKNQRIESLRIIFDDQSRLTRFEVDEAQGQRSEFQLDSVNTALKVDGQQFTFKVPAGVEVDDQR